MVSSRSNTEPDQLKREVSHFEIEGKVQSFGKTSLKPPNWGKETEEEIQQVKMK